MATITGTAAAGASFKELTLRGIVLGALITVLFTAANVYLGLKLGITFATSIPAAVISLAVSPKDKGGQANFSKALNRFTKEDPTLRVHRIRDVSIAAA